MDKDDEQTHHPAVARKALLHTRIGAVRGVEGPGAPQGHVIEEGPRP